MNEQREHSEPGEGVRALERLLLHDEEAERRRQELWRQPSRPIVEQPVERLGPPVTCKTCNDLKVIDCGDPTQGTHGIVPCPQCGLGERAARLRRLSGLTEEMQGWTLGRAKVHTEKQGAALKGVQRALAKPRGFLTLWGGHGTLKTYLMAGLVNAFRAKGIAARYVIMADLLDELRRGFNDDVEKVDTYDNTLDRYKMVRVLCIDELDKFNSTPFAEEKALQIIDYRYRNAARTLTVFGSNSCVERGKEIVAGTRWPGYLESRVLDGRFQVYELDGGDVRPSLRLWATGVDQG